MSTTKADATSTPLVATTSPNVNALASTSTANATSQAPAPVATTSPVQTQTPLGIALTTASAATAEQKDDTRGRFNILADSMGLKPAFISLAQQLSETEIQALLDSGLQGLSPARIPAPEFALPRELWIVYAIDGGVKVSCVVKNSFVVDSQQYELQDIIWDDLILAKVGKASITDLSSPPAVDGFKMIIGTYSNVFFSARVASTVSQIEALYGFSSNLIKRPFRPAEVLALISKAVNTTRARHWCLVSTPETSMKEKTQKRENLTRDLISIIPHTTKSYCTSPRFWGTLLSGVADSTRKKIAPAEWIISSADMLNIVGAMVDARTPVDDQHLPTPPQEFRKRQAFILAHRKNLKFVAHYSTAKGEARSLEIEFAEQL